MLNIAFQIHCGGGQRLKHTNCVTAQMDLIEQNRLFTGNFGLRCVTVKGMEVNE